MYLSGYPGYVVTTTHLSNLKTKKSILIFYVHLRWAEGSDHHNQLEMLADGALTVWVMHQQLNTPAWKRYMSFPLSTSGRSYPCGSTLRSPTRQNQRYLTNSLTGSQRRRKPERIALSDLDQEGSRRQLPQGKWPDSLGIHSGSLIRCHQRAQPLSLHLRHCGNHTEELSLLFSDQTSGEA